MIITVHRWFANKSCPGNWLYSRLGDLAAQVTAQLSGSNGTSGSAGFPATPFQVRVIVSDLNIRKQPCMGNNTTGKYTGKGMFTIVEVKDGWGKLKSGAGWIWLKNSNYCTVLNTVG